MEIGFTGTQQGMTESQLVAVGSLLDVLCKDGGHGTFAKLPNNRVSFTLPCTEQHTFDLEDLLILVDQL